MIQPNPELEFQTLGEQKEISSRLLDIQIRHVLSHSPFYRKHFAGRTPPDRPEGLFSFLASLPTTTRAHLEQDSRAFLCCPMEQIAEVVCTSGTAGAPVGIYLTAGDLEKLAVDEFYAFTSAGFAARDVVQLCVTMDSLFMAGMAYYLGLQKTGCAVLRQGPANPARQLDIMRRHGVTAIVTVPSFLHALSKEWAAQGLDAANLQLKRAVLVGENIRTPDFLPNRIAQGILQHWPIRLYASYGNTEMNGSAAECEAGCGAHVHPDIVHAEILDDAGNPVPSGQTGELTVTTLNAEGTPLIRYRTGDLTFMVEAPCACGRKSPRLGPILARASQMLKVKGTKLYPAAIQEALAAVEGVADYVIVADRDRDLSDRVRIHVALVDDSRLTESALSELMYARLRIHPDVIRESREAIRALAHPPGYRKRRSFIDRREPL